MSDPHPLSEQIQEGRLPVPPADADPSSAKPPNGPAAEPAIAAAPPRWLIGVDRFLALLLLGLAFLLGSFAAANSEVWMHLASGRLLAEGTWNYGVDPFSFSTEATDTTPAVPWYNPHWLYSFLLYEIYQLFGGGALVVMKAILVVVLIACLLQIRPPQASRLLTLVVTLLVALAITPRLLLAPTTVSFLFLGLTLLLLYKAGALTDGKTNEEAGPNLKMLWCVPLLFVAWANLDSWVILGPLLMLLLWLGSGLGLLLGQRSAIPGATLGLVFGASVLACLVNPHHVHIFQLPTELAYLLVNLTSPLGLNLPDFLIAGGKTIGELERYETQLSGAFASPFAASYWRYHFSSMAYFGLLLLSLASFIPAGYFGNRDQFPVKRFVVWVVFGALSLALYRMVPFFAIVAGPLAILNVAETSLLWQRGAAARWSWQGSALARLLLVPLLLLLFFLAWPGWITGTIGEFAELRRVSWTLVEDESLRQTALRLGEEGGGHKNGARVFNFSTDIGDYCAWFAPQVKCCLDNRLALFARVAPIYAKTRHALHDADVQKQQQKEDRETWETGLKQFKVDYVAFNITETRNQPVLDLFWSRFSEWSVASADGKTVAFHRHEEGAPAVSKAWDADHFAQAFGSRAEQRRPPPEGTLIPSSEISWWDKYRFGVPKSPLEANEAILLVRYFELGPRKWIPATLLLNETVLPWNAAVSVSGVTPGTMLPVNAVGLLNTSRMLRTMNIRGPGDSAIPVRFLLSTDAGPPAFPVVAARLARRAVAEAPYDFRSYFALFRASAALGRQQENSWYHRDRAERFVRSTGSNPGTLRDRMRFVQMATALRTSLLLHPDDWRSHYTLAKLYLDLNVNYAVEYPFGRIPLSGRDLGLEHLREAARILEVSPLDSETRQKIQKDIEGGDKELEKRLGNLRINSGDKKPLEKAFMAIGPYSTINEKNKEQSDPDGRGLALEALRQLQEIDWQNLPENQQRDAMWLNVDLLLFMGRAAEVAEAWRDKDRSVLGPERQFLLAAALGDYVRMDQILGEVERILPLAEKAAGKAAANQFSIVSLFGDPYLPPLAIGARIRRVEDLDQAFRWREQAFTLFFNVAEWRTLRGIIALEAGNTDEALHHLKKAVTAAPHGYYWNEMAVARRYLQLLKDQRK